MATLRLCPECKMGGLVKKGQGVVLLSSPPQIKDFYECDHCSARVEITIRCVPHDMTAEEFDRLVTVTGG